MAWSDAVVRLAEAVGLKGKPEAPKAEEPVRSEAANADTGPRIGSHGIDYTAGVFHEEYHADLDSYADRVDRFNELRVGDSVIASQLLRLETPIAQARWTFEPPEGDQPLPSEAAAEEQGAEDGPEDDAEDTAEGEPQPETDQALADAPPPVIAPAERIKKQPADPAEMQAKLAEADADERTVRLMKANLLGQGAHEYRMCQPWRQFLHEAQTARAFGFSLFERTYRRAEGPMGSAVVVDGLWWMHPRSIERWHLDENGELLGIVQTTQHYSYEGDKLDAKPKMEYRRVYIPADRLVVITRHKEGAHVEGVGTIRHVYGDAKHAAYLRKATRIDASKRAIGIPRVSLTADASPEVKSLAVQQAKRMRMGDERLFVVDTPGVTTGFVDMQANTLDVSGHMRGAEDRIRMAHGTEWSALGSTGAGGSYSAGDVQSRYFNIVLEADAEWLRESIQRQIVEPLAALNSSGGSPVLRVYDVSPREIGPILEAKKASLLTWTAEDEQDIRRQLRLRQLTEEELAAREQKKAMGEALAAAAVGMDPAEAKAGDKPAAKPGAKPAPPVAPPAAAMPKELAASPKRRPLTDWEARYHDAQTIEEERAAMVRDFLQAIRPLRAEAAREAVRKATIKGTSIVVPRLKRKALEETIARFILRARELGRDTMREEVRRQVADLTAPEVALAELPPFDPKQTPRAVARAAAAIDVSSLVAEIDAEMQALTVLNVDALLGSVEATVKRQLLNAMSQYSDEEIAREIALREALDGGKVETERIARESVNRGIVNGRAEVAEQASETLAADGLTLEMARRTHVGEDEPCGECMALDGTTCTVGSPDYYANMPPAKCLGGSYCHCQYVYEVTK